MRVLLLSDIHANIVALDAVLKHAPPYEKIWCLGDVVGYGPAPNECCERLRELRAETLAGNHDYAALGKIELKTFSELARAAMVWTREALNAASRAWLETLEQKRALPELGLTLVHGSPRHPLWEYIDSSQAAAENMYEFETGVCLFGHTHLPRTHWLNPATRVLQTSVLQPDRPVPLRPKLLINPGSVGQPRDGNPQAAYALLDVDAQTLTGHRVRYDVGMTQAAMRAVNLPAKLIARLEEGR